MKRMERLKTKENRKMDRFVLVLVFGEGFFGINIAGFDLGIGPWSHLDNPSPTSPAALDDPDALSTSVIRFVGNWTFSRSTLYRRILYIPSSLMSFLVWAFSRSDLLRTWWFVELWSDLLGSVPIFLEVLTPFAKIRVAYGNPVTAAKSFYTSRDLSIIFTGGREARPSRFGNLVKDVCYVSELAVLWLDSLIVA